MRLPQNTLPEDGLLFFYRITLWVERNSFRGTKLPNWKKTVKQLKQLRTSKPKQGELFMVPAYPNTDTLYVPIGYSGYQAIAQLRNVFCHDSLRYDKRTNQYSIASNKHVKIAGSFSLAAIKEFVSAFLSPSMDVQGSPSAKGKKSQSAKMNQK